MREDILEAVRVVAFGREAHDPFPKQIKLERSHLRDENINAHVPLGASDEQRVMYVLLNNALLVVLQILQVADDRYFTAAGQVGGLADPHLLLLLAIDGGARKRVHELLRFIRQTESQRREVVNFAEPALVPLDQSSQVVLRA